MIPLLARLLAAVLFPKDLKKSIFFSGCRLWRYTDSGPAKPRRNYDTSPGPDLPTDANPRTRSFLGAPSPLGGNASSLWRNFEAQGLGAHVA